MRVAIRGRGSPSELSTVIQRLVDRLNRAGVNRLVGVNLYLRPLIGKEELELISDDDEVLDILEMPFSSDDISSGGSKAQDLVKRPLSDGRLLSQWDAQDRAIFFRYSEKIGIPKCVLRRFLGNPAEERWLGLNSDRMPELTGHERYCFQLFVVLYDLAERVCGSPDAMFDWFMGPYPHSRLAGETPAEQIIEGGLDAVKNMVIGLDTYLNSLEGGCRLPPRHYDLLATGQKK